jgi:hypothetical protein
LLLVLNYDWLELYWLFFSGVAQFSSQWEARADTPEEMPQTLLTNQKAREPGLSARQ